MLMPLDDPPDLLYRTDRRTSSRTSSSSTSSRPSLIRRNMPLWINEGWSDYDDRHLDTAGPDDASAMPPWRTSCRR